MKHQPIKTKYGWACPSACTAGPHLEWITDDLATVFREPEHGQGIGWRQFGDDCTVFVDDVPRELPSVVTGVRFADA